MWYFILFIVALLIFLLTCATECCQSREDARREHPDNSMCRMFLMGICIIIMVSTNHQAPAYVPDPKFVSFWMRSGRTYKGHWQITNYRKPSTDLPSNDYLMGVEMAKTNMCSAFNFGREADVALFKRCTYFFPELLHLYRRDHQQRVGVIIEV